MKTGFIIIILSFFFSCQSTTEQKNQNQTDSVFIYARPIFNNSAKEKSLDFAKKYTDERIKRVFGDGKIKTTIKDSIVVFAFDKTFGDIEKLKDILTGQGKLSFYSYCPYSVDLRDKIKNVFKTNNLATGNLFESENVVGQFNKADTARINKIVKHNLLTFADGKIAFAWSLRPMKEDENTFVLHLLEKTTQTNIIDNSCIDSAVCIISSPKPSVKLYLNQKHFSDFFQMVEESRCKTIATLLDNSFAFPLNFKSIDKNRNIYEMTGISWNEAIESSAILSSGLMPMYFKILHTE